MSVAVSVSTIYVAMAFVWLMIVFVAVRHIVPGMFAMFFM